MKSLRNGKFVKVIAQGIAPDPVKGIGTLLGRLISLDDFRLSPDLSWHETRVHAHPSDGRDDANPMGGKAADLAAMELEAPRRALVDFRCARIENSHLVPRIVGPERSESLAPGALAVIHLLRRPTDLQSHRTAITYRLDHRPRPVLVCLHRHPCWKSDTFRFRFAGRCLVGRGYATWVAVGRQPCGHKPMLTMQFSHAFRSLQTRWNNPSGAVASVPIHRD